MKIGKMEIAALVIFAIAMCGIAMYARAAAVQMSATVHVSCNTDGTMNLSTSPK